jgi:bacterioferritin
LYRGYERITAVNAFSRWENGGNLVRGNDAGLSTSKWTTSSVGQSCATVACLTEQVTTPRPKVHPTVKEQLRSVQPIVEHLGVEEVLVYRGELACEHLVEKFEHLLNTTHCSSPFWAGRPCRMVGDGGPGMNVLCIQAATVTASTHGGYGRLGARFRSESIGEMKDADELIERILYLDGHPNVQWLGHIAIGETCAEKLNLALGLERDAIARLNSGIALCVEKSDNGSRELLEGTLGGEEDHADWLETQMALIEQLGEAHYLAQQIHD